MSYKIEDVMYETARTWVLRDSKKNSYIVFIYGSCASISESAYTLDDDGLSKAKTRADYLNKHTPDKLARIYNNRLKNVSKT